MLKGKPNTNNVILSEEQFKDIKESILENVLKVLADIFPVIMDKVSVTLSKQILKSMFQHLV